MIPDGGRPYIGDGGLETTMIFEEGIELPEFASFLLLEDDRGRDALVRYYEGFLGLARDHAVGFTLDTPTWRASRNWGERLGYSSRRLAEVNRTAVEFGRRLRDGWESATTPVTVCGTIGPEGDAYRPRRLLGATEAEDYHSTQVGTFAGVGVDMVSAYTLSYVEEAIGIVRAAVAAGLPVSISFTVGTDGRLPSGEPLAEAVERLDAETGAAAEFLMVNCAHPSHFAAELESGDDWVRRIAGFRANASRRSHAELDEAADLDSGDPVELGREYGDLAPALPDLRVIGGCCGTDRRHLAHICAAVFPADDPGSDDSRRPPP
ncbi:MAG TPA: homocysteine S-methyltransferase family protein [Solirubrobacterales bacterium]|nr:homocysteine S-methyltransferase family protein [Solirubrobacterales bacterium]